MTTTQELLALQILESHVRRITDEYNEDPSISKANSIVKAVDQYLEYRRIVYQEYDASVFDADEKTRKEDELDSDSEYEEVESEAENESNSIKSFATHDIPGANIVTDPTTIDGIQYPSGMHAFQSFKLCYTPTGFDENANKVEREKFANMTLGEAVRIGKSPIKHFDPLDWDQRKDGVMKNILSNMSFDLLPEGRIVQYGIDSYFGAENGGKNIVGKLLMEIREERKSRKRIRSK